MTIVHWNNKKNLYDYQEKTNQICKCGHFLYMHVYEEGTEKEDDHYLIVKICRLCGCNQFQREQK
jgi:hypothetical protein